MLSFKRGFQTFRNSKGISYTLELTNPKFESFYRAQNIVETEKEWNQFLEYSRKPLPQSFRINSIKSITISSLLKRYLSSTFPQEVVTIPWYLPSGYAYQIPHKSRWDLSKEKSDLHSFITQERSLGNIYRQEIVSMVPVALLDIGPKDSVLDMCSSPGSKTTQILEKTDGLVVANEPNFFRLHKLMKNIKLSGSGSNCLIVQHDGRYFPEIYRKDGSLVRYDKIVCDVPCSGDGTIRKNPNIWLNWHPIRGNERHSLQYRIAKRGLELLKPEGIMVYSSCSINQIENEAVLARLVTESEGRIEIINPPIAPHKSLKWYPGLSYWNVYNKSMNRVTQSDLPTVHVNSDLFPPSEALGLDKSMRFLPHLNDDGGFFVAYLKRISLDPPFPESSNLRPESSKKRFTLTSKYCSGLEYFFDSEEFFKLRKSEESQMVYSVSEDVQEICDSNKLLGVQSAGTPALFNETRKTFSNSLRFKSQGIHAPKLLRTFNKRVVCVSKFQFISLLKGNNLNYMENSGPIRVHVKDTDIDILGMVVHNRIKLDLYPDQLQSLLRLINLF